jgi:hypothetical protein
MPGSPPGKNLFFLYYYIMTGLHLCHVLLGLVIQAFVLRHLSTADSPDAEFIDSGADYELNPVVTVGVLLIAFIKVQLIIWFFMEVNVSPGWLRKTCWAWLGVTGTLILSFYAFSL